MKFVFRRLLLGVAIVPMVAVAYFSMFAVMVGFSYGIPTILASEVWNNGLMLGVLVTLAFSLEVLVKE